MRAKCAEAAALCRERGGDLGNARAAILRRPNEKIPTHIVGTANPKRILQNIREAEEPIDEELLAAVQTILAPIHNVTWPSGRPENN